MVQALGRGQNEELSRYGQQTGYRAFVLAKFPGSETFANDFKDDHFPLGVDIAELSSKISSPGSNPYNNFIDQARRPRFRFEPKAVGFYISDLGANKAKSILIENSRVEIRVGDDRVVNQPMVALPPGLGVRRVAMHSGASDSELVSEVHGPDVPMGLFQLPPGLVMPKELHLEIKLYVERDALAALRAIEGTTPAQGWSMGAIFYGKAFASAGVSI